MYLGKFWPLVLLYVFLTTLCQCVRKPRNIIVLLGDDIGWNEVRQSQKIDVKNTQSTTMLFSYNLKVSWHNPNFLTPNLEVNNLISLNDYKQDFRFRNLKVRGCC